MSNLNWFDNGKTENRPILILTTLPANADDLWLQMVLTEHLAGCITKLPGAVSTYLWKGKIVTDNESVYLIKSSTDKLQELTSTIIKNHPYEIPEIAVFEMAGVNEPYWHWLNESLTVHGNSE